MDVDRERFLLLAAAIAAGCAARGEQPLPAVAIEPGPAVAYAEPTATSEPPLGEPNGEPAPQAEGFATLPSNADAAQCRGQKVARPKAVGCDDSVGRPGDCRKVKLPQGCQSFSFVCDQCESYKTFFKPRVAQRAVDCVLAQRGDQLGDGCRTYACGDEALQSACLDPSADASCRTIAKQCGTTLDECRGLLSGMNASGRAKIAACAAGGCDWGIWPCIEGL